MNLKKYSEYIVQWIIEKVKDANAKGVVVALSGGIDSALVACLAKKAFPKNSLGISLPIGNMDKDLIDIEKLVKKIKIKYKSINLTTTFDTLLSNLSNEVKNKMAILNIKPRLRMTTLYSIAQENNYLVLGTDNKIEWEIGYFTKYGDGGVDLLPISQLLKSEVKNMSQQLGVPESILSKAPSAGLWEGQIDEKELGFSYDAADKYFLGKKVSKDVKNKIERLNKLSEHKRNPIPHPMPRKLFKN